MTHEFVGQKSGIKMDFYFYSGNAKFFRYQKFLYFVGCKPYYTVG